MNKSLLPMWIFLGILALFVIFFSLAFMSANNTGNKYEQNIEASFIQSQNVLGQQAPKIREAIGVTKVQTKAVEDVIKGANQSRYGEDGSVATMQWISEQNPNLDQATFTRIVEMIEAGRNDFREAQERTIDQNRAYKTALGNMPGSFFLRLAGYPTEKYLKNNYDQIVVSNHASDSFKTRRDDGIDIGTE